MAKNHYSHITSLQLAKITGVSQGTVDRALNDRTGIHPETKKRILEAAKTYGYSPNLAEGAVKGTRSMLYGIVLLDLHNDYFSRLIMDFEALCRRIGYNSVVMFSHNRLQTEIGCLNQLVHLGVDGIVLCSVGKGEEYTAYLRSLNLPLVTIGNRLPGLPFVGVDDFHAMWELTTRATSLGYEELLYYAPVLRKRETENIYAQEERYRGFLRAAEEGKRPHRLLLSHEALTDAVGHAHRAAVICPTDVYAIRVCNTLREMGRTDLGVSGFDNCELLDKGLLPLDSLAYDREALTEGIYDVLTGKQTEEITQIPHRIVPRGSMRSTDQQ